MSHIRVNTAGPCVGFPVHNCEVEYKVLLEKLKELHKLAKMTFAWQKIDKRTEIQFICKWLEAPMRSAPDFMEDQSRHVYPCSHWNPLKRRGKSGDTHYK